MDTARSGPDMLTLGALNELADVRHGFFGRQGGTSQGLYATLNCGPGSKDDPARVARNRESAMRWIGLDASRLVTAHQVHSARVAVVEEPWPEDRRPQVDALVTTRRGTALGVLTADCAPVLLADARARVVGAAHAGWRGALHGVLEAVVEAMVGLGARPQDILAGIGPTIGQRCYEVGPEFPAPFLEQAAANGDFFAPGPRPGHFLFDLKGYAARRLGAAGIGRVAVMPCDTCAEAARFFSYRRACKRGEADYGRNLSVVYLDG